MGLYSPWTDYDPYGASTLTGGEPGGGGMVDPAPAPGPGAPGGAPLPAHNFDVPVNYGPGGGMQTPAFGGSMGLNWRIPGAPEFRAPTMQDVQGSPGYSLRLAEGDRALTNSQAAKGVARTGGSIKDFINYNQNFASNEYNTAYGQALQAHNTRFGAWQTQVQAEQARALAQYQREMDIYRLMVEDQYRRWALRTQIEAGSDIPAGWDPSQSK